MTEETVDINKKQARFKEVAQKRTSKALNAIAYIGDIGKMPSLEPIIDDVDKIVIALQDAVEKLSERLISDNERGEEFKL
ncbi:hypothetical protein AB832_08245 [Flavobacteriaceae bacterium (ex Bugula neritina AB1)]|nr:hypothetical protein AB832_08245 [Flavobacteriaceae bacterium (ex Bugula neritina AB1)]